MLLLSVILLFSTCQSIKGTETLDETGEMTSVSHSMAMLTDLQDEDVFITDRHSGPLQSRQILEITGIKSGVGEDDVELKTPSTVIRASYNYISKKTDSGSFAHFNLYTAKPSINLDSYKPHIRFITCRKKGEISLLFSDEDFAARAFKMWDIKKANDSSLQLAVFLGHETQCLGLRSIHMATVIAMNRKGRIIRLQTSPLQARDLILGYDLHMRQVGSASKPDDDSKKFSQSLNFNYDPSNNKVKSKKIRLVSDDLGLDNTQANVICYNCYTNGSVSVEFKLKAKFLKIQEYMVKVNGNLVASLDLGFNSTVRKSLPLFDSTLVNLPLGPLVIPGLFECGPSLQIKTGINAGLREYANFKMGFDIDLPLSLYLHIPTLKSFPNNPEIVYGGTRQAIVNGHVMEFPENMPISGVSASFTPQISIKVKLFDFSPLGLSIGFSNSVGVDVIPERTIKCIKDVNLYHSHMLGFDAYLNSLSYHKNFWYSGRNRISCSLCKCN